MSCSSTLLATRSFRLATSMNYWEIIADNLSTTGRLELALCLSVDSQARLAAYQAVSYMKISVMPGRKNLLNCGGSRKNPRDYVIRPFQVIFGTA